MKEEGFTLIEVLLVLAVSAIISTMAGLNFSATTAKSQGQAVTTELAAELRFARQLAISRRERIRVVVDMEHTVLRTERADVPGAVLKECDLSGKGTIVERLSGGPSIVFHPSGRSATATTITLRDGNQHARKLTVSFAGKVSVS
jgi:type IV fimbrial biogenesis protein FimT